MRNPNSRGKHWTGSVAAAVGAGLLLANTAAAGIELPEGFDIIVSSELGTWALSNNLDDIDGWVPDDEGGGHIEQQPNTSAGDGWLGDFAGTGFGAGSTSIFGNFSLTNTTGSTVTYTVSVLSPLLDDLPANTQMSGSISATVVDSSGDGSGATLGAPSGGSIYNAFVNGTSAATLMDDPFELNAPAFGTNSATESFPLQAGPLGPFSQGDPLLLEHTFSLTPGDGMTISSIFTIVPAPGAIAVFALAGIVGKRRRRD